MATKNERDEDAIDYEEEKKGDIDAEAFVTLRLESIDSIPKALNGELDGGEVAGGVADDMCIDRCAAIEEAKGLEVEKQLVGKEEN